MGQKVEQRVDGGFIFSTNASFACIEIANLLYEHISQDIQQTTGWDNAWKLRGKTSVEIIHDWAGELSSFMAGHSLNRVRNVLVYFRRLWMDRSGRVLPSVSSPQAFIRKYPILEQMYLWKVNPIKKELTEPIMHQIWDTHWHCSRDELETAVGQSWSVYNSFLLGARDSGVEPLLLERLRLAFPKPETFLVDHFLKFKRKRDQTRQHSELPPIWVSVLTQKELRERGERFFREYGLSEERNKEVMDAIMNSVKNKSEEFDKLLEEHEPEKREIP